MNELPKTSVSALEEVGIERQNIKRTLDQLEIKSYILIT